jgi:hypothetical protein
MPTFLRLFREPFLFKNIQGGTEQRRQVQGSAGGPVGTGQYRIRTARSRLGIGILPNPTMENKPIAQDSSTSLTRRSLVAALRVAPVALAGADYAHAQAKENTKETAAEKSLYDRLGGVFAIAAVVDHFSDAVVKNPIVGQKSKNPQLRGWHTNNLKRLPASSSCARCGFATFRVGRSSSAPQGPARRLLLQFRAIRLSLRRA